MWLDFVSFTSLRPLFFVGAFKFSSSCCVALSRWVCKWIVAGCRCDRTNERIACRVCVCVCVSECKCVEGLCLCDMHLDFGSFAKLSAFMCNDFHSPIAHVPVRYNIYSLVPLLCTTIHHRFVLRSRFLFHMKFHRMNWKIWSVLFTNKDTQKAKMKSHWMATL